MNVSSSAKLTINVVAAKTASVKRGGSPFPQQEAVIGFWRQKRVAVVAGRLKAGGLRWSAGCADEAAPTVEQQRHVIRDGGFEVHFFAGTRVPEAEGARMQGLSRTGGEAVFDEPTVA